MPAIPRTHSGKKLEVPVKRILLGAPPEQVASRGSLADPDALDAFVGAGRRPRGLALRATHPDGREGTLSLSC